MAFTCSEEGVVHGGEGPWAVTLHALRWRVWRLILWSPPCCAHSTQQRLWRQRCQAASGSRDADLKPCSSGVRPRSDAESPNRVERFVVEDRR